MVYNLELKFQLPGLETIVACAKAQATPGVAMPLTTCRRVDYFFLLL